MRHLATPALLRRAAAHGLARMMSNEEEAVNQEDANQEVAHHTAMNGDVHAVAALAAAAEEADVNPALREMRDESHRALKRMYKIGLNHIKRTDLATMLDAPQSL